MVASSASPPPTCPGVSVRCTLLQCYNAMDHWKTMLVANELLCMLYILPASHYTGPWSRALDSIQTDTGIMSGPEIVEASQAPLIYDKPRLNELKL